MKFVMNEMSMNKTEQRKHIISMISSWAGGIEAANIWFDEEFVSALGCTPGEAVEAGHFDAVVEYIESISMGGYA